MRQRAALARALSLQTGILLMDEPFGALDEQTRMILGEDLSVLLAATHKTIVFVTHSLGRGGVSGRPRRGVLGAPRHHQAGDRGRRAASAQAGIRDLGEIHQRCATSSTGSCTTRSARPCRPKARRSCGPRRASCRERRSPQGREARRQPRRAARLRGRDPGAVVPGDDALGREPHPAAQSASSVAARARRCPGVGRVRATTCASP